MKKIEQEGRVAVFIKADKKTHWQGNIWAKIWKKWGKEPYIYLMMSISSRHRVNVIAQMQELGAFLGPLQGEQRPE